MSWSRPALDLSRVRTRPLAERRSLASVEAILVDPAAVPGAVNAETAAAIEEAARRVRRARGAGPRSCSSTVPHLVSNGAALIVERS